MEIKFERVEGKSLPFYMVLCTFGALAAAGLVATLYALLRPGGEVHLMTDKEPVGLEMRALFEAHGGYEDACGEGQFCSESTTGVRTREETYYMERGDDIYRLRFVHI